MADQEAKHKEQVSHLNIRIDEGARAYREINTWKDAVHKLEQENVDQKRVIDELEVRNRTLVDKLNNQIYSRATEYKEKTLQVLMNSKNRAAQKENVSPRTNRPSGPLDGKGYSAARLENMLQEERREIENGRPRSRSPLKPSG